MNTQLLMDAVMRQTPVLIAQLATTGGVRAPLWRIANQVFVGVIEPSPVVLETGKGKAT